ncbi:hypothetical protein CEB3_c31800 [Peptococcaceae bacterium CEB3]|nr:hypothetical protein CEB3_c31800 [Peptococcaceae bacterium CEB3]
MIRMIQGGKYLSISKKQIFFFYALLAAVWLWESVSELSRNNIGAGLLLFLFGAGFLAALYGIQSYFSKMLRLYQSNLTKARAKGRKSGAQGLASADIRRKNGSQRPQARASAK